MTKKILLGVLLALGTNFCYAQELQNITLSEHKVTLSGDELENGFYRDLTLEMQRENAPDRVKLNMGGYWPSLRLVTLRKGQQQLYLEARQGGQQATSEYRIFALRKGEWGLPKKKDEVKQADAPKAADAKAKEVKPRPKPVEREMLKAIFDDTESIGLIKDVTLGEKRLTVQLLDGTKQTIPLADKIWDRIENFYKRGYEPNFQGLTSLVPYDADGDGVEELYATQRMELDHTDLGYVAARVTLQQDDTWRMSHYVLQLPSVPKDGDKLNLGLENAYYTLHDERIYLPKGQGAYPRFYHEDEELAGRMNEALEREYAGDLDALFQKNASMGFEVMLDYEKILTIRFIGGNPRRNHFLSLDPRNGKLVTLKNMFITNGAFLKKMSQLSPSKRTYKAKDLSNWYMKDTTLNIVLDEGTKQRVEQFKLGAFEEFLQPKNEILQVKKRPGEEEQGKKGSKEEKK